MARHQPVYVCSSCGGEALKWQGQCPHCSEWNTLSRLLGARPLAAVAGGASHTAAPVALVPGLSVLRDFGANLFVTLLLWGYGWRELSFGEPAT